MNESANELSMLAAELVSLARFAGRAPTEHGRRIFFEQLDGFVRDANRLGYPTVADAIDSAKQRPTWAGKKESLNTAAAMAQARVARARVS